MQLRIKIHTREYTSQQILEHLVLLIQQHVFYRSRGLKDFGLKVLNFVFKSVTDNIMP